MSLLDKINPAEFRKALPEFKEKTEAYHNGEISKKDYKGFSGKYGSYAQRDDDLHMLRLRMTAGRVPKDKLNFTVDVIGEHGVDLAHFTTCQTIQLQNLKKESVYDIMDRALDHDIVSYGGGGDYPRNVMCSPLTGTEADEYFDVLPYAEATADFLMHFIDMDKMPRKLKVAFSNSPKNLSHATFRDLGFVARPDGNFDVYAAGGLGNKPRLGVKVAENINPDQILYYVYAMIETFKKYGDYKNRAKARTRYMVEKLGSEEAFRDAFLEELKKVEETQDLTIRDITLQEITKEGDGETLDETWRVIPQKQEGLYTVRWHSLGGSPDLGVLKDVNEAIQPMEDVELRLAPDQTAYIINLTAGEAKKLLDITEKDAAKNPFQSSVGCIGNSICQVGVRNSQELLQSMMKAVREADIADFALPQVNVSGCPSSCGAHQTGDIGFRGGVKVVDKKPQPAFTLFTYGNDEEGKERIGKEIGAITIPQIPEFIVKLGKTVEASGKPYDEWIVENPDGVVEVAKEFI